MPERRRFAETIERYVSNHINTYVRLWEDLVNVDSGTYDPKGVNRVGDMFVHELGKMGFAQQRIASDERFGHHRLCARSCLEGRPGTLLLLGHLDTVWPEGTVADWPFRIRDGLASGPGVADMKGGLVAALAALQALDALDIPGPENVIFLLLADEEVGSPTGRALVERVARHADWSLCLEPGRTSGAVVTGRGGLGAYVVKITGKSAHVAIDEGASAVKEMAQKVLDFESLTDREAGVQVSVGVAKGGVAKQVVPDYAEMHLDVRARTAPLLTEIDRRVREVAAKTHVPGTETLLEGGITRPVFPRSAGVTYLYEQAAAIASSIGVDPYGEAQVPGGSDASFVAAKGIPVLDGLGPVGHFICSRQEVAEMDSFASRSAIIATLMATVQLNDLPKQTSEEVQHAE